MSAVHSSKTVHVSKKSTGTHVAATAQPSSPQPSGETPAAVTAATAPTPAPSATTPSSFAARVTAAVAAITQARSLLGLDDDVLSTKQVQRAVKLKKGGEQQVPALAALSARYGVEVPSRPTADMTASLEKATQLEPARAAIAELSSIVDGSYFASRSDTWATATSLYSMLKKGSSREPKLATALEPLQEFFASRHPSVAKPKRSPVKAVDKAQAKLQKRLAKLQAQVAELQASQQPPTESPAPADVPVSPQSSVTTAAPPPPGGATHTS